MKMKLKKRTYDILFAVGLFVALFSVVGYIWFSGERKFGATVLPTNSSDTLTTFRTNVNTSLANLNAALGAATTSVNWWTARQNFTNASTSQLTATSTVWFTSLTNALLTTDGDGKLVASTTIGSSLISGFPSGANPTGTIGLSAVNGSATTFLRSDGAPALSQSISPTWTGLHIFNNSTSTLGTLTTGWATNLTATYASSTALTVSGNTYLTGITSSLLGTDTTGKVVATSTIGASLITGLPAGANPSASIGLAAVNGSATTFLRSDGAPALAQDIVPTWTGLHTFSNAIFTNATSTNFTVTGNLIHPSLTSALLLTNSLGFFAEYAGTSCTNQFVRSLDALGAGTCATVANTDLTNSSVSLAYQGGITGSASVALGSTATFNASTSPGFGFMNATSTTIGSTFVLSTSTHLTATTNFWMPSSASCTNNGLGNICFDTTANQFLIGTSTAFASVIPTYQFLRFSYATSTLATGTTTRQLGSEWYASVYKDVVCYTDVGTLNVQLKYNASTMTMLNASTTMGTTTLSTSNQVPAGAKISVDIGTPASSPTVVACTVRKTQNPL